MKRTISNMPLMMRVLQAQKLLARRAAPCSSASLVPHALYSAHNISGHHQLMSPIHLTTHKLHNDKDAFMKTSTFLRSVASDIDALQNLFRSLAANSEVAHNFEQCLTRLMQCHSQEKRVFVTGMGKSGAVAQRLASTLSSISISSQWVHGGEWVHGELGGLKHGDIVIIISHSGRTSELLPLPAMFQKAGCCVMAVVGDGCSPLSRHCNLNIIAPAKDETGCPVPSRSIIVQEAICNAIVQHLIENMVDGAGQLRESHPGGAIGARFAN